ncbi:hypothetical protein D3I60_05090 [Brevibacterium permense]|nr:hypothetical protein [Brevibacterium permense]
MKTMTQAMHGAPSTTTAQRNLFAFHAEQDEWRRARLVACSVEQMSSNGVVIRPYGDVGKIMIEQASELIGVPTKALRDYLQKWNHAAITGRCTSSGGLTPEDGLTARLPGEEEPQEEEH